MGKRRSGPQITLTEGLIRVHWGSKTLTILPSPSPPNTEDPADFLIDMDSIVNWDAPHEDVEIEVKQLQKTLQAIDEAFEKLGLDVAFD